MTLENTLQQNLAKWRFPAGDRRTLTAENDGWVAAVHADSADTVGCHVWEVTLSRPAGPTGAVDLKARAQRIADSVTGLLEPLKLLEVDAPGGTALLRSEAPKQSGDSLFYYEVLLGADGAASARRYQAERAGKRKQIAYSLTHEALAKLAGDLAV